MDNNSSIKKAPNQKHRSRNPFSRRDRDNFPSIDDFLQPSNDGSFQPLIGPSASSPSDDGDESSVFNMSIGARAALTEHLRHIAKHGVDGETPSSETPNTLLDLQWEQFLEGNACEVQDISRESTKSSTTPLRFDIHTTPVCALEQSIEVMTDVSTDYFNSPRVKLLATPERNRDRTPFVSTRNEDILDDDDDDDDEGDSCIMEATDRIAPELLMMHMPLATDEYPNGNTSFQSTSFCAPDISRISSAEDSEPCGLHQSLNVSVQLHNTALCSVVTKEASPMFLEDPSSHTGLLQSDILALETSDSSGELNSTESPPHNPMDFRPRPSLTGNTPSPLHAEASFDRHARSPGHSQRSSMRFDIRREKENALNIQERARTAKNPGLGWKVHRRDSASSAPMNHETGTILALETMQNDFMTAIESARMEGGGTLSPISPVGSHSGGVLNESSSLSSRKGRRFERARGQMLLHPPSTTPSTQLDSSSSSSSSLLLKGRKRFRTVVPRRVYLDSPSQFQDEQDSFGHNSDPKEHSRGSEESRHAQRSLLDSFEATIEEEGHSLGCSACYPTY